MSADPFTHQKNQIDLAHALRLAVIQQQYDLGNITAQDARELLNALLSHYDPATLYDDSDQLKVDHHVRSSLLLAQQLQAHDAIQSSLPHCGARPHEQHPDRV